MELEDYAVDFDAVSVPELRIRPGLSKRDAVATLAFMGRGG
jgi:hypothetical protein